MQSTPNDVEAATDTREGGSFDGSGVGDHDQPYRFGWRPRSTATYPFSTKQYMRLLVLRSRIQGNLVLGDGFLAAPMGA